MEKLEKDLCISTSTFTSNQISVNHQTRLFTNCLDTLIFKLNVSLIKENNT